MLQARLDEVFTEVREELAQRPPAQKEVINVEAMPDIIELSDDEPSGGGGSSGRSERRRRHR